MTAEPNSRSRRAVLGASLGGLAALVAQAIGRPAGALAANGDPVIAGQEVNVTETTTIRNDTTSTPVFISRSKGGTAVAGVVDQGDGTGISGQADGEQSLGVSGFSSAGVGAGGSSNTGTGVHGSSQDGTAIYGAGASAGSPAIVARAYGGATGVLGFSGDGTTEVPAGPLDTGVYGYAVGYPGRAASGAVGVLGRSAAGTGVHAQADAGGTALRVSGKASFSRSGTISFAKGKASASKSVAGLTSASLVFAVVRSGDGGAWVRKVTPTSGKFTVYLNKAVSSTTSVGWIAFG